MNNETGLDKSWKSQVTDQILHMLAALVVLSPLISYPCFLTAVYTGFACGMIREVTQGGDPVTLTSFKNAFTMGSLVDISFWIIGSAIAWCAFH